MLQPLRHPNIVAFYGIAIKHGSVELEVLTVLELCSGSLQDMLKDISRDIGWIEKMEVSSKIATGLTYLHSKGVVHRDLKPGNILMHADGTPKIADFGLSRKQDSKHAISAMTANIGTPVYMAPELMVESAVAEANGAMLDVYSFGVMLWEIMARESPYAKLAKQRRLNLWSLRDLIVEGERPSLDDNVLIQGAPTSAVLLMRECWAHHPDQRPSGFDEISQRLHSITRVLQEASQEASQEAPQEATPLGLEVWRSGDGGGGNRNAGSDSERKSSMADEPTRTSEEIAINNPLARGLASSRHDHEQAM
jgi:serine/threonine protein kinase